MEIQIVGHTSFLGHTGYNNHSRNFFTHLDKLIPVRVRNYTYVKDLSYLNSQEKKLLIEQKWQDPPYKIGTPFKPHSDNLIVNIVLNESHHYYFYDKYEYPMIAYNVWESTRQLPEYFNRVLEYDQFWCPTEWQRQCTIEQGYPEDRVKVVPEGVNGNIFYPATKHETYQLRYNLYKKYNIPREKFSFIYFGRWDYRKSTEEVVRAFYEEFKNNDDVVLILSADNPFAKDGMKTTEERLKHYKLESDNIKVLHFPSREEYIQWMQAGHVFLSCARSEGWNLPLIEAIACGTPSICSNWGAQLEFAKDVSYLVDVPNEKAPEQFIFIGDSDEYGVWGEPDFDHLKIVMRKVYNEYKDAKPNAVKLADQIRSEFTWDNAAMKAKKIIHELVSGYKPVKNQPIKQKFKTYFEIDDGSPKVTFESSVNFKNLLVYMKDSYGNIIYETSFDDLKVGLRYWVAASTMINQVKFEIFDKQNQCLHSETFITDIDEKPLSQSHGMELYQDQYVNDEVVVEGKRDCSSRYEVMKQVFEKYNRPFTILDIGANFGYYSIRAATEYGATAVMVESEDNEVRTLMDLCNQNKCKDKLTVLQTRLDLYKLKEISKCEHFDVILALNVIHHFNNEEILEVCETFTKLGDNLILETPPAEDLGACGQNNLKFIVDYFSYKGGFKLGEFKRHTSNTVSEMVWFKTDRKTLEWPYYEYEKLFTNKNLDIERLKNRSVKGAKISLDSDFNKKKILNPRKEERLDWIPGINLKTFIKLNGIYPDFYNLIEKIKTRDIQTDYKWDDSNNDLITHNFILNGTDLYLIDFDDKFIDSKIYKDQLQIDRVISDITDNYSLKSEKEKVKLNLGCGNIIKPGYVNIDRYNNTGNVDFKADLGELPFANDSVDEVYTSHVFEHIGLNDIYSVVEEWRRVLVLNGKLVLRLPNLEKEVNIWLNTPDNKKWFAVGRIFGSQSHEGNTHLCGFNPESLKSFLECFDFKIQDIRLGNRGYGEEIQCTAIKKLSKGIEPSHYTCHFVDGPFMEVRGDSNDKGFYLFDFLDPDNESSVHQDLLGINCWTRPNRRWYTNWLTRVRRNGKLVYEHAFDCKGKNVLISLDSKSLGDTIAWFPYAEEFRKEHDCNVWVSSFWNNLFEGHETYKHLNFIQPGSIIENLYASYIIGCYDNNLDKNKVNWRIIPLQKVASDTLGLEYKEIVTDIGVKPKDRPIKEKYVTLSEHSTFQCKYYNYPGGWQTIVDYLNDIGYKVMVISKEKTKLKNIIDRTNRPLEETITNIGNSEFFMGVSAGPAWLAWTLKVPVVMISGYSAEFGEFSTGVERIINKEVCNSCFNELDFSFDRGDWNFCPRHKNTPRQFECTKKIEPEVVINSINKLLGV